MSEKNNIPHNERIMAFTDGVFAITITLLVLEIQVPNFEHSMAASKLVPALYHLLPKFYGFILSFVVLGIYWIAHHNMFIHITKHNHILMWLNNLFILCTAALPFTTGLLGEYNDQQIAVVIFGLNLFLTGLMINLIWWYAAKYELVDKETTSPAFISSVQNYMKIAPILYLISIFVSFFSLTVAKFIFVIVAVIYIFPNPFHRRRYKQFLDRLNSD
jgi:uncharacterized membrane protein